MGFDYVKGYFYCECGQTYERERIDAKEFISLTFDGRWPKTAKIILKEHRKDETVYKKTKTLYLVRK